MFAAPKLIKMYFYLLINNIKKQLLCEIETLKNEYLRNRTNKYFYHIL